VADVSGVWAVIAVVGPHSRELLASVSRNDWSNPGFPFGTIRPVGIGPATCLASRRNYMGELGFELYIPTEMAASVYDTLKAAGERFGIVDGGYYAIESLRLEKGYRAWGRELTPDDNPFQAGLGFAVKPGKGHDFLGRDALLAAKAAPLSRRLVSIRGLAFDGPVAWGGELLMRDGMPVGEVTSAAWGHTLGGITALGWLRLPEHENWDRMLASGRYALDIAGESVHVAVSLQAFHDPASLRPRA
jgi:4-methylaminobutanoate oxidase (formaldehyde-forming)